MSGAGLYGRSLALLTDLYQLTMAFAYWKAGLAEREAVFHLYFRASPFGGEFSLACGLGPALEFLDELRFSSDDLQYLASLRADDGSVLFEAGFLDTLASFRFSCDMDAVPEGTAVFPQEPLVRVRGPILQGQLLETPLLNLLNFQTLIATKAARICLAAGDDPVLEFGLRRAQGIDGGLAASRAAYVGGAAATSNVLAGRLYGLPVRGTHAHSWVMAFGDEREAFEEFARALPSSCIFLVDTYDSLEGVRNAIAAGRALRARGHELLGVRLDSGDLASLSREARRLLDEAGFPAAAIVASSDLDEHRIAALKAGGAPIGVWGVGTRLATGYDQPAMGGVYKLSALREPDAGWSYRLKLSEEPEKSSLPGVLQVRRYRVDGRAERDVIYDAERGLAEPGAGEGADLLVPVYRAGRRVYPAVPLADARAHARTQLASLPPAVTRLTQPERFPVTLDAGLCASRDALVRERRERSS